MPNLVNLIEEECREEEDEADIALRLLRRQYDEADDAHRTRMQSVYKMIVSLCEKKQTWEGIFWGLCDRVDMNFPMVLEALYSLQHEGVLAFRPERSQTNELDRPLKRGKVKIWNLSPLPVHMNWLRGEI